MRPRTNAFLAACFVVAASLSGCAKKKDDLCERAVSHISSIIGGGAGGDMGAGEKAISKLVTEMSVTQCKSEGLSKLQADCILAAKGFDGFTAIGQCEAIRAKQPSWLMLPPSAAEMEMIRKSMQPPDGPKETTVRYEGLVGSGSTMCGLRGDGSLQCWGSQEKVLSKIVSNISWDWHQCGLDDDGVLVCVSDTRGDSLSYLPQEPMSAFSEGRFHGCGILTKDGSLSCWSQEADEVVTPPKGSFSEVVSGLRYSCARDAAGAVQCFGAQAPSPVPESRFQSLSAGLSHVCGLRLDGSLECFGPNAEGSTEPPTGSYAQLSCGNWHCCAIAADSSLACWGKNSSGEATAPTGSFTAVEASVDYSCGVRETGTVCWGTNHMGQCNVPQEDDGSHHWLVRGG